MSPAFDAHLLYDSHQVPDSNQTTIDMVERLAEVPTCITTYMENILYCITNQTLPISGCSKMDFRSPLLLSEVSRLVGTTFAQRFRIMMSIYYASDYTDMVGNGNSNRQRKHISDVSQCANVKGVLKAFEMAPLLSKLQDCSQDTARILFIVIVGTILAAGKVKKTAGATVPVSIYDRNLSLVSPLTDNFANTFALQRKGSDVSADRHLLIHALSNILACLAKRLDIIGGPLTQRSIL